jgi:FtsH-binding integral membrane protein
MGTFFTMGVWGLLLASLANLFFRSSGLFFAISLVSVVIFTGLIAYSTQMLKDLYYKISYNDQTRQKVAILGALQLYASVINLFLAILRLTGERR